MFGILHALIVGIGTLGYKVTDAYDNEKRRNLSKVDNSITYIDTKGCMRLTSDGRRVYIDRSHGKMLLREVNSDKVIYDYRAAEEAKKEEELDKNGVEYIDFHMPKDLTNEDREKFWVKRYSCGGYDIADYYRNRKTKTIYNMIWLCINRNKYPVLINMENGYLETLFDWKTKQVVKKDMIEGLEFDKIKKRFNNMQAIRRVKLYNNDLFITSYCFSGSSYSNNYIEIDNNYNIKIIYEYGKFSHKYKYDGREYKDVTYERSDVYDW